VVERALTVFLAGAECPFTCSFCDLWRYTIDGPTPRGALPKQIDETLASLDVASLARIKLYNASNFFDRRAVPLEDLPRIADACGHFGGVTVESHARTIDREAVDFAHRLDVAGGARLEVAIGLETIHPRACADLNKRLDRDLFDRAASFLTEHGIDLRVFVLLGVPEIPAAESIEWTVRSAEHAAKYGAALVSIIPLRGGNGEMERLAALGLFKPPTLRELESALEPCIGWKNTVVTIDLWDAERVEACPACREQRVERMRRMNVTGSAEPPVQCSTCQ
jgi:hypothetical protein